MIDRNDPQALGNAIKRTMHTHGMGVCAAADHVHLTLAREGTWLTPVDDDSTQDPNVEAITDSRK
jgi:hypothetical protein